MPKTKPKGKIVFVETRKDALFFYIYTVSRLLSLGVVLWYAYLLITSVTTWNDVRTFIVLVEFALWHCLLLLLIWFPKELGDITGVWVYSMRRAYKIDAASPAPLVAVLGWVLLLMPVWLGWITSLFSRQFS